MSIGKKLNELLQSQGIEEAELAEQLGISLEELSDYLNNRQEPDTNMLNKAAKYLSVSPDYFAEPTDIQAQICQGLSLGYIEDIQGHLADHQKLVDYLICEISNLSHHTLNDKHVYTYMLELSNCRVDQICKELDNYILRERKRILGAD